MRQKLKSRRNSHPHGAKRHCRRIRKQHRPLITEPQLGGKKRMKGEDFVRGKNVRPGDVLGEANEEN
ncbi:hypothetical protein QNN00_20080 [Bacillus velezensis]|nr:hypothetical protein [Bacillus velezensis]